MNPTWDHPPGRPATFQRIFQNCWAHFPCVKPLCFYLQNSTLAPKSILELKCCFVNRNIRVSHKENAPSSFGKSSEMLLVDRVGGPKLDSKFRLGKSATDATGVRGSGVRSVRASCGDRLRQECRGALTPGASGAPDAPDGRRSARRL